VARYVVFAVFATYALMFLFVLVESFLLVLRQRTPEGTRDLLATGIARTGQLGGGLLASVFTLAAISGSLGLALCSLIFVPLVLHSILVARTLRVATMSDVDDEGLFLSVGRGASPVPLAWSELEEVGYGGTFHPFWPRLWRSGLVEALAVTRGGVGPYRVGYILVTTPESPELVSLLRHGPVLDMPATWASVARMLGLIAPVRAMIR